SLALGTPVISTDCPSGPSELLPKNNLMPMKDVDAIANKLSQAINNPQQFQAAFDDALLPVKIAKKYVEFTDS
ncbi:MAG: glycosyltransferase, partial [Psychrobacter sp.]|nr:glycosyltransferase [Psychrobacter sp.]